jgi:predicted SAM-dependent methyltransferase
MSDPATVNELAITIGAARPRFDQLGTEQAELRPDNSVEYIYCTEIDALTSAELRRVLTAAMRILRPEGVIRVATQDLDAIVYSYLLGPAGVPPTGVTRAQRFNEWRKNQAAQFVFNEEDLRAELERAGFVDIWRLVAGASSLEIFVDCEPQDSGALVLEARKPAGR